MSQSLFDTPNRIQASDADSVYAKTLSHLLQYGEEVQARESLSVGSDQDYKEILNFSAVIENPHEKLIFNKERRVNLPAAIARFIWMMAGSDRLADIAFYEPKVSFFSDDNITVPGSNYGHRILYPRPGINQLNGVIERLKETTDTRRAAISIYHPEDAVRTSRDIPCAFGIFYHIREGSLHATTVMRSNNAHILLPYNIFEFALLAEVVAAEVGVPLGTLTHTAVSMHLYSRDTEKAKKVVNQFEQSRGSKNTLPEVSPQSSPLDQVNRLAVLEADLRHKSRGITGGNIETWIDKGEELNEYWRQFYYILLLHVVQDKLTERQSKGVQVSLALDALKSVIDEPWKSYLPSDTFEAKVTPASSADDLLAQDFSGSDSKTKMFVLHDTQYHQEVCEGVEKYEKQTKDTVTWREFDRLGRRFAKLAAREKQSIEPSDIKNALEDIRSNDSERT